MHGTDFCRIIEKRIRKNARLNKLFRKSDKILVKDDISEHFVKKITKDMPVSIVKSGKADKIVESWTADDEINNFFMNILGYGEKQDKNKVKIFLGVTDDELEEYCRLNGISFRRREKDKEIKKLIDSVTVKHPDSRHKAIKSIERLQCLWRNLEHNNKRKAEIDKG